MKKVTLPGSSSLGVILTLVFPFVNFQRTIYVTHLWRAKSSPVILTSLRHILHEVDMVLIISAAVAKGLKLSVFVQSSTYPQIC